MMRIRLATPILLALFVAGPAIARETIVGRWAPTAPLCKRHFDVVIVSPKGLMVGDDFVCDFRTVERQGDVVTWRGACGYSEDREPATVVARLAGGRLDIGLNGNRSGIARSHQRCPR